jgi:hypothetical protein
VISVIVNIIRSGFNKHLELRQFRVLDKVVIDLDVIKGDSGGRIQIGMRLGNIVVNAQFLISQSADSLKALDKSNNITGLGCVVCNHNIEMGDIERNSRGNSSCINE